MPLRPRRRRRAALPCPRRVSQAAGSQAAGTQAAPRRRHVRALLRRPGEGWGRGRGEAGRCARRGAASLPCAERWGIRGGTAVGTRPAAPPRRARARGCAPPGRVATAQRWGRRARDGTGRGRVRPHRSAASRSARESQPDGAAKGVKVTAAPAEGEPSAAGLPLTRGTRGVCRGGWRSPGMNSPRPSGGAAAERRRLPGARERRAALLAVSAPAAALGRRAWGRDFPKACAARSRSQRGDRSLRATRGA